MHISEFYVTGITITEPRVSKGIYGVDGEVIDITIHTKGRDVDLTLFSGDGEKIQLNLPEGLLSGTEHGTLSQMEEHNAES